MPTDEYSMTGSRMTDAATADTDRSAANPLRFGIMYNGGPLSAWQARCIRELVNSGVAVPALAIANGTSLKRKPVRRIGDLKWKNLLFEIYLRLFGSCSATLPTDERPIFANLPIMRCAVERRGKFSEVFSDSDLEEIASHNLDFILRFGFGIIRGKIHDVPKYGVWSFHHDDERAVRGAPSALWPIYNGSPQSGVILQRLNDKLDGGVILRRMLLPTIDTSYIANREQAFLAGIPLPTQVCRDILAGNTHDVCAAPSHTDAPIYYRPTNTQMVRFIGILCRNRLRRLMQGPLPPAPENAEKRY